MVNASTTSTYYNDVRVGDDAVVYGVNRGWDLITNQLNYERMSLAPPGMVERCYDDVVQWAQDTKLPDGRRVIDQEWVQINLARVRAKTEYLKLINWKVCTGKINPGVASSAKVFGTEFFTEAYRLLLEVVGPGGQLRQGEPDAALGREDRARHAGNVDPDVRRRHQRGAARPHRPVRPRPPPGPPTLRTTFVDFTLSEEQEAIAELAGRIFTEKLPPERLREIETDPAGRWFADDVWNELAKSDLLGVCLPESVGGGGYGFVEACLLAEQQGRAVAPLPLVPTLVLGALPIARFGSREQQALLAGVIDGSVILTAALTETGDYLTPSLPATDGHRDGGDWRLTGTKVVVPAAHLATRILVPARVDGGAGVFIVDPVAGRRRGRTQPRHQRRAVVDRASRRCSGRATRRRATTAARSSSGSATAPIAALCSTQAGCLRRRAAAHRRLRVRAGAVRLPRSGRSRRSRNASPTPTSTPRPSV